MSTLDSLPTELLRILFENLNLNDLRTLRNVSRRFRSVCEIVRVKEVIINDVRDDFRSIWFHTNDTIDYREAIRFSTFLFNFHTAHPDLFALRRNLRRLHFGFWNDTLNFNFGFLDSFAELEQLDIQCPLKGGYPHRIRAPNLKTLSVDYFEESECPAFFVECPKLERLKIDAPMELVHVEHKENVRYLEVPFYKNNLEQFRWIECLQINYTANGIGTNRNLLAVFERLKQLRLHLYYSLSPDEHQELGNAISSIFRQKSTLGSDLRVYLAGVEFEHAAKFDEFRNALERLTFRGDQEYAKMNFQIQNFNQLSCDDLSFFTELNYTCLLHMSGGRPPENYFSKFFNIRYIKVTGKIARPDRFLEFLREPRYLKALDLKNAGLSQRQLDQLPDFCQISYLYFEEELPNLPANYDFILRFRLLIRFVTNQNNDGLIDLALRAFSELKYMRLFRFKREQDEFSIACQGENRYSLAFRGACSTGKAELQREQLHFGSLVTYCQLLKSNELLKLLKLFSLLFILSLLSFAILGVFMWVCMKPN